MAARKFFGGGNWKCNGTGEDVKKIVTVLNEAEVPSEDVVGGGEPAVRVPAASEGAASPGLLRRRAELLGAQGRRLHRRDQPEFVDIIKSATVKSSTA